VLLAPEQVLESKRIVKKKNDARILKQKRIRKMMPVTSERKLQTA